MKNLKRVFKKVLKNEVINNESGQGATEYILLLVVVVAIVLLFREPIIGAVKQKMSDITGAIGQMSTTSP